jgi:hypothetical protein
MLYPTVTEVIRGTAHPESQRSQTVLPARSPGLEPWVAIAGRITESGASRGDFRRRIDTPLGLDRCQEESGAVQRIRDVSRPAEWRGPAGCIAGVVGLASPQALF